MAHKFVRMTGDQDNPAESIQVEELDGDSQFRVTIGERSYDVVSYENEGRIVLIRDHKSSDLPVERRGDDLLVRLPRGNVRHQIMDERTYKLQRALGGGPGALKPELLSPMAGKIVQIEVEVGQEVEEGQTLLIVEAMKMENEIRAVAATKIKAIRVAPNDTVDPGQILIEFDLEG